MTHIRREWIAVGISVVITIIIIAIFTVFLGENQAGIMLFGTDSAFFPLKILGPKNAKRIPSKMVDFPYEFLPLIRINPFGNSSPPFGKFNCL